MNSDLAIHRVRNVVIEDKVNYHSDGRSYALRSYTLQGQDCTYSLVTLFADPGSALDAEIRAAVGKTQEAA